VSIIKPLLAILSDATLKFAEQKQNRAIANVDKAKNFFYISKYEISTKFGTLGTEISTFFW